jgi:uncharacterized protein (DUF58 family)
MDTNTSLTILVVILSVTLAVFLILGIILLVTLIQVANSVKHITLKAEEIADKAEAAAEMLQNAAAPVAFGRVLSNIFDTVNKFKRK